MSEPGITLVPMLAIQRGVYDFPPGRGRFDPYIAAMTGPSGDLGLPLAVFNPMGKAHVAETLDALLALDADGLAARALVEAAPRLDQSGARFRLGLVVVDDRGGGWTNRFAVDFENRARQDALLKRGWAIALLWSSETPAAEAVRREVLAAAYRTAYVLRHGWPSSLRRMMRQEGLAAAFAGATSPALDPDDLAYTREVIGPHLDSADFPTIVACLEGDAAARTLGFSPLGLSSRAGYAVALADALVEDGPPEAAIAPV